MGRQPLPGLRGSGISSKLLHFVFFSNLLRLSASGSGFTASPVRLLSIQCLMCAAITDCAVARSAAGQLSSPRSIRFIKTFICEPNSETLFFCDGDALSLCDALKLHKTPQNSAIRVTFATGSHKVSAERLGKGEPPQMSAGQTRASRTSHETSTRRLLQPGRQVIICFPELSAHEP